MSYCTRCGKEIPEGALFCTSCGAVAPDLSSTQPGVAPSYFNTTLTTTSQPQAPAPPEGSGYTSPPAAPEEKRPSAARRGFVLVVIVILAIILVGTTVESGFLGPVAGGPPAINSPSDPLTGSQLYAAYTANQTQAAASYTNKTLYIQDSLDFGVTENVQGQFYSYVGSGNVVLIWSSQAQVGQLYQGAVVLAKCSVVGLQVERGIGDLLFLQDCNLVSLQSQSTSTTTSSVAITSANNE